MWQLAHARLFQRAVHGGLCQWVGLGVRRALERAVDVAGRAERNCREGPAKPLIPGWCAPASPRAGVLRLRHGLRGSPPADHHAVAGRAETPSRASAAYAQAAYLVVGPLTDCGEILARKGRTPFPMASVSNWPGPEPHGIRGKVSCNKPRIPDEGRVLARNLAKDRIAPARPCEVPPIPSARGYRFSCPGQVSCRPQAVPAGVHGSRPQRRSRLASSRSACRPSSRRGRTFPMASKP